MKYKILIAIGVIFCACVSKKQYTALDTEYKNLLLNEEKELEEWNLIKKQRDLLCGIAIARVLEEMEQEENKYIYIGNRMVIDLKNEKVEKLTNFDEACEFIVNKIDKGIKNMLHHGEKE